MGAQLGVICNPVTSVLERGGRDFRSYFHVESSGFVDGLQTENKRKIG